MSVCELREAVVAAATALDVALVDRAEAERLRNEFETIRRAAAAASVALAKRVVECGAAAESGDRSDADWLARTSGVSVGAARRELQTAADLARAPETEQALRRGAISEAQAAAVAAAVAVVPDSEDRLLRLAQGTMALKRLEEECQRVRNRADDATARHERIHRNRSYRR